MDQTFARTRRALQSLVVLHLVLALLMGCESCDRDTAQTDPQETSAPQGSKDTPPKPDEGESRPASSNRISHTRRVAYNATSGARVGVIVGEATFGGHPIYKVDRDGRIINVPVTNTRVVEEPVPATPRKAAQPSVPKVDRALQDAGEEFCVRLRAYSGTLRELQLRGSAIHIVWESSQCDMWNAEAIDLVLSLNRGFSGEFTYLDLTRYCNGQLRQARLSGRDYRQYVTAQINDQQLLSLLR